MPTNAETQSATIADRWIESLQILAGPDDNPTAGQRAEMGAVRTKMLAALKADLLAAAIEAARSEYLVDDTGTDEDRAYNKGVSDAIAAIAVLGEPRA